MHCRVLEAYSSTLDNEPALHLMKMMSNACAEREEVLEGRGPRCKVTAPLGRTRSTQGAQPQGLRQGH